MSKGAARVGTQFGLLGGLVAGALSKRAEDFHHPNVSWLRYLPVELRSPKLKGLLRRYTDETLVLTIERKTVKGVYKRAKLNNVFDVEFDDDRVTVAYGLFSAGRVKRSLRDFGWPVDWKGERFNFEPQLAAV